MNDPSGVRLEAFSCPRLGRTAYIQIQRFYDPHYPDPANRPTQCTWHEVESVRQFQGCQQALECGVAPRQWMGDKWYPATGSYDWDSCPAALAHKKWKEELGEKETSSD